MRCWKNLLIWFGLLGLLCIPLSSALHDFSVSQYMDSEFRRFKSGNINNFDLARNNPYVWSRVRIMYSNVIVSGNVATLDLVFNAPEDLLTEPLLEDLFQRFKTGATDLGLDDIDVNVSVIPNRVFHYAASDL